jgi:uncharacterized cupin superfamily protein
MAGTPHRICHLDDTPLEARSHGRRFAFRRAALGKTLGLEKIGCALTIVPPGKAAYPFHKHHVANELFVILSGEGEHRWGNERHPVKEGDVIAAPRATGAHQLVNTGAGDLRYLAISSTDEEDILEYPDSGKIAFAADVKGGDFTKASIAFLGKPGQAMDYYDGEPE